MPDCYDHPHYYELAFDFRDLPAEARVIRALQGEYSPDGGRDLLHLACGPAQHLRALHDAGYRYAGLDLSRAMVGYARERAAELGIDAAIYEGSMIDFRLERQFDVIFTALGDLYARNAAELDQHFDSVSAALKPGGLYLMDWCIQFEPWTTFGGEPQSWQMEKDGIALDAKVTMVPVSAVEQTFDEVLDLSVRDGAEVHELTSVSRKTALYPQQFLALIAAHPALEFCGWWNNWDPGQSLTADSRDIFRPIALVRRKET
nr:class I SAM-dependent methyltransferase [uncultured Sphingomonas sp.]